MASADGQTTANFASMTKWLTAPSPQDADCQRNYTRCRAQKCRSEGKTQQNLTPRGSDGFQNGCLIAARPFAGSGGADQHQKSGEDCGGRPIRGGAGNRAKQFADFGNGIAHSDRGDVGKAACEVA